MKYRKGFVTNSSSSSFICEICNNIETGYDLTMYDANMVECENNHTFCLRHIVENPSREQKIKYIKHKKSTYKSLPFYLWEDEKIDKLLEDEFGISPILVADKDFIYDEDCDGIIPTLFCPICNLDYIPDDLKLQYLLKSIGKYDKELKKEIFDKFLTIEDLEEFLKK